MGRYKAKDGTEINTDLHDELRDKDAWIAEDGTIFSRDREQDEAEPAESSEDDE
ncbi:MAG TPA: hypothetical protein VN672_09240 [Solirubrobacteraceae bacterium]|nr:hypothetical protein [Solirubrobacteraceae bacterium]